jgi:Prokaryotic E2 family A/ThiF family/Prokaryotic homologs of the JAB domain
MGRLKTQAGEVWPPQQAWWRLVPDAESESFFSTYFEQVCQPEDIAGSGSAALIRWISSGRDPGLRLLECRKTAKSELELLIVDLDVSLGQRKPVNSIQETETIGIVSSNGTVPCVFPLRAGFPLEVPHLNAAFGGVPSSFCLFDLPYQEVLRILSPVLLVERTRWWLRETAHGRLHGDDQPLDPVFGGIAETVILPELSSELEHKSLIGFKRSDSESFPILVEAQSAANRLGLPPDAPRFSCVVVQTQPVSHGRLRALPQNLGELLSVYAEREIDLAAPLVSHFQNWLESETDLALFNNKCLLIIATPIERVPGQIEAIAAKGFFSLCPAKAVAEALGAIWEAEGTIARPLPARLPDTAALNAIALGPAHIQMPFDRRMAQEASGYSLQEPPHKILQIGAGALGSQIALTAARGGVGQWTIIDPDHLLPHNLARHALSKFEVGMLKAEAVASEINSLLGPQAAVGHGKEIQSYSKDDAFDPNFDFIVDASASVPVARWLADESKFVAPVVSAFVNPSGNDLVLLREGADRKPKLDHLEMDYYWHLVCEPDLEEHLKIGDTIIPSGGCRRPSLKIPQTKISVAASQAVESIFAGTAPSALGSIDIFQKTSGGSKRFCWSGSTYEEVEIDGWKIAVSSNVLDGIRDARDAAGQLETGGILVGAWDRSLRKGWIVAHQDPPPDSEHSPTSFVRGSVGVYRSLRAIEQATAANLGYVGEWHTHPPGHSSQASSDDALLMRWIGNDVQYNDVPALMMIGGDNELRIYSRIVSCSAAV